MKTYDDAKYLGRRRSFRLVGLRLHQGRQHREAPAFDAYQDAPADDEEMPRVWMHEGQVRRHWREVMAITDCASGRHYILFGSASCPCGTVRAGDGNQQHSGLRGDPGAPRTVDDDTRDPASCSDPFLEIRALIEEMREADQQPLGSGIVCSSEWADRLAVLLPVRQQEEPTT